MARLGQPADTLQRSESADVAARDVANTDAACALGIFGSPSFVHYEGEGFWGDDRPEEALEWACSRP